MTDLIVDGNSLYARAWYATAKDFIDANDVLRSALQTVFSLINPEVDRIGEQIDRTLFCWDGDHGRDKGERQEKPREYDEVREIFKDVLTALIGAAHARPEHHEADDAVATAIYNSKARLIYVVSGDKDLTQLMTDRVRYYDLNQQMVLSRNAVLQKFHVKHPNQVSIALAILGDRTDNIKGIRGWGPAKVKKLFERIDEDMTYEDVVIRIEEQIPPNLHEDFYASLDRTLLDHAIPGLPGAAPIKLASYDEMREIGISGLGESYARLYKGYTGENVSAGVAVGMDESD